MKKIKTIRARKSVLEEFDVEMDRKVTKRSTAIETLMERFNAEYAVDENRLKKLLLARPQNASEECVKFTINADEQIMQQFFAFTDKLTTTDSITNLMVEFLMLKDNEKFSRLFGVWKDAIFD